MVRYRSKKNKVKREKKDFKKTLKVILIIALVISLVGYLSFIIFKLLTTNITDTLKEGGSSYYLLSNQKNGLEKTVYIFEEGSDDDKQKITGILLEVFNKEKNSVAYIYIPGWLYFGGLQEDFGNAVPVSSFKYAGNFLKTGRGIEYAVWQIEQLIGIKVDNYVWFSNEANKAYKETLLLHTKSSEGIKSFFNEDYNTSEEVLNTLIMFEDLDIFDMNSLVLDSEIYKESIYSNLSFLEILKEMYSVSGRIKNLEPIVLDLSQTNYIEEKLSDTGGMTSYFVSTNFDKDWRTILDMYPDKDLEKERVRVEVYNGSGISGAAYHFARKIENSGCEVVRYDNSPNTLDVTTFYVPNVDDYKKSLDVVGDLFLSGYTLVESRPDFMTTGDIVVVLGKDIQRMYSF